MSDDLKKKDNRDRKRISKQEWEQDYAPKRKTPVKPTKPPKKK